MHAPTNTANTRTIQTHTPRHLNNRQSNTHAGNIRFQQDIQAWNLPIISY
jgi:hypothetical protein